MNMSMIAVLFLLIGSALLIAEIFIPGFGVCGIMGIIFVMTSFIFTIISSPIGIFIVGFELLGVLALIFTFFKYISSKQLHGKIILDDTLNEDKKEIGDLDYFLGKCGITKTPLRPQGYVDFNGITVEAFSDSGFISVHSSVKVIDVKENKIFVNLVNSN